ncbi:MAG: PAS domain-containing protein [Bacteroidota bacterium]
MNTTTTSSFTFKSSPLPIAVLDEKFSILECSGALLPFFELSKRDKINTLFDLLGDTCEAFGKNLKMGERITATLPIISRKGKLRWIRTSIFSTQANDRQFQVYFDDVTEGKIQYELAMQAKKIAKIGSWKVDLVNNTLTWSEMTKMIHEVPQSYVPDLEKGINFYKEGKHRNRIIQVVAECIESGTPYDVELIIVTAKGNEKWVRAIGEAERSNGKTVAFRGVFQDIDDIKKEKRKNEELNDRMRAAVESANIGIWDWNVADNNLIWDDNMFTLFGLDRSEFTEAYEAWETSLHPQDKEFAASQVKLALEGEKEFDTEFRIIKKDGSVAHIQGRAQVFRNKKGQPLRMVGTNADITALKRKDDRLRRLLEVTEKQNQKLVNFAHIVSHNLRSNSSNISMLSGMLVSDIAPKEKERFLKMIHTSSEKLEDTLNQLNEIIKIQQTGYRDLKEITVFPILENVCESINAILKESNAEVRIKVSKSLKVWGIPSYLTSIFMNLLSNAIKYKTAEIAPSIEIESKNLGHQTVLAFHDNGLGIDLKKHGKNLFGMYKTFHNNKDAKGMGLYMSKNQMEAMNGKIEVKSRPGAGSTFYLYFKNIQ